MPGPGLHRLENARLAQALRRIRQDPALARAALPCPHPSPAPEDHTCGDCASHCRDTRVRNPGLRRAARLRRCKTPMPLPDSHRVPAAWWQANPRNLAVVIGDRDELRICPAQCLIATTRHADGRASNVREAPIAAQRIQCLLRSVVAALVDDEQLKVGMVACKNGFRGPRGLRRPGPSCKSRR